ncbi:MAG TPA: hypothetical protein VFQ13_02395 [Anaerolineales bacterium]|nr:hypothetical protein [Anaerolineales bacterium]
MNQPETSKPDSSSSFIISFFLLLMVILVSAAPVVIEQMNRPERLAFKLLSRSGRWQVLHASTGKSQWEASDGSTAEHVRYRQTTSGIQVVLEPTELMTREAYFNKEAITADVFRLSTEVDTPAGCHNGLVFRGNAQGEYYLFLVSPVSYTVEILRRQDNSDLPREAIIPNTPLPKFIGEPHTITVIADGQSYLFYINNVFVNRMNDSRLNGNRTGIEVFT